MQKIYFVSLSPYYRRVDISNTFLQKAYYRGCLVTLLPPSQLQYLEKFFHQLNFHTPGRRTPLRNRPQTVGGGKVNKQLW